MSVLDEEMLTFSEAARLFPGRRPGKRLNRSQIDRWAHRGLHGVKLEHIVLGQKYTSRQALVRFADTIARKKPGKETGSQPPIADEPPTAARHAQRALESILYPNQKSSAAGGKNRE